jgi:uncharacterized protein YkwD
MILKLAFSGVLSVVLLEQGTQPAAKKPEAARQAAAQPAHKATEPKSEAKPTAQTKDLIEVEKEIVEQTNAQRAKYGLPPLSVDRSLIQTARTHAAWMTNNRTMQHTTKPVGENIAMGQRNTGEAVNAWMNSPGHRANILSNGYKRIGVAAYRTPDGTCYWCQQFLP